MCLVRRTRYCMVFEMSIIFMRALLSLSRALLSQSDVREMDFTCVVCGVSVIVWLLTFR